MGTDSGAVPREARALAALASAVCLPPLIWLITVDGPGLTGPVGFVTLVTLGPLACRGRDAFRAACLCAAIVIVIGSVIFVFFGGFLLIPAVPVLVAARRRARMGTQGRLASVLGWSLGLPFLVGGLVLLMKLVVLPNFGPPDEYDAVLRQDSPLLAYEGTRHQLRGDDLGPGVSSAGIEFVGGDLPRVIVILAPDSSAAERTRVRERLAALPGVIRIRDCHTTLNDC